MARLANPEIRFRLLAAGRELFFQQGFNGTGVQDITAHAKIPKGSFYNYFNTKDEFVVEVIADYWQEIERSHAGLLVDIAVEPLARIARYFRALTMEHGKTGFRFGCLIGNMALEIAQSSDRARNLLAEIVSQWQSSLTECLIEAQRRGEMCENVDPREIAAHLIEAWEGAALRSKIDRTELAYLRFEKYVIAPLFTIRI